MSEQWTVHETTEYPGGKRVKMFGIYKDGPMPSPIFYSIDRPCAQRIADRLNALQSELTTAREALRRAHGIFDGFNADVEYAACRYCSAEGYDGDGLKHDDDCIITTIRRLIGNGAA